VYDSKEFMGKLSSMDEEWAARFYKISQKTSNHLHSLGVLHQKKNDGEGARRRDRAVCTQNISEGNAAWQANKSCSLRLGGENAVRTR
jgi:hypothetical protein